MHVWSKLSAVKWQDAWEERFLAQGQTNCVISELPGGKSLRIEVYCETAADADAIQQQWGGSVRELQHENWAAMGPPQAAPIKIRDRFLVSSESDAEKFTELRAEHPGRRVLSIPAELAFGTGDHATTSTCLRLLVDIATAYQKSDTRWSMLDIGSGTGLLAIAGHHLGAATVEGFDFDETAVAVSLRNLTRNDAEPVKLYAADVFEWQPAENTYEVIAANIFADILNANLEKIATALKPGGHWILSGILDEHADGVHTAIAEAGLPAPEVHQKGKWVTMHGRQRA